MKSWEITRNTNLWPFMSPVPSSRHQEPSKWGPPREVFFTALRGSPSTHLPSFTFSLTPPPPQAQKPLRNTVAEALSGPSRGHIRQNPPGPEGSYPLPKRFSFPIENNWSPAEFRYLARCSWFPLSHWT